MASASIPPRIVRVVGSAPSRASSSSSWLSGTSTLSSSSSAAPGSASPAGPTRCRSSRSRKKSAMVCRSPILDPPSAPESLVISRILRATSRSHSDRTCLPAYSSSSALLIAASVAATAFLLSRSEKDRLTLENLESSSACCTNTSVWFARSRRTWTLASLDDRSRSDKKGKAALILRSFPPATSRHAPSSLAFLRASCTYTSKLLSKLLAREDVSRIRRASLGEHGASASHVTGVSRYLPSAKPTVEAAPASRPSGHLPARSSTDSMFSFC